MSHVVTFTFIISVSTSMCSLVYGFAKCVFASPASALCHAFVSVLCASYCLHTYFCLVYLGLAHGYFRFGCCNLFFLFFFAFPSFGFIVLLFDHGPACLLLVHVMVGPAHWWFGLPFCLLYWMA